MSPISPFLVSPPGVALVALSLSLVSACTPGKSHRSNPGSVPEQHDAPTGDEPIVDLGDEDSDYLFDPAALRTFELRLREEDLAYLDADPKAEQYVPGELVFEGKRVKSVGIRYKGSTGSFVGCLDGNFFPPTGKKACLKLSMKIKIDYGDPKAKFYGQKKLLFHAMNTDRSLMRERLGYGLFREMGVNASRTAHIRLLINGKLSGLYLLVEEVDGRFTRSRFAEGGEGNLYKEVWPVGGDESRYLAGLETNRDEGRGADKIAQFGRALSKADDDALPALLSHWLDGDYVARYVAVDRTIRHDDGPYHWYCQPVGGGGAAWHHQTRVGGFDCGNHNFYWYEERDAERLWPIPWDLDGAMTNRPGLTTLRSNWDDTTLDCTMLLPSVIGQAQMPLTCDPLQRGWALALRAQIKAAMRELLDGPLSPAATSEKLNAWSEQIMPVVEEVFALYPSEQGVPNWLAERAALETTLARLRQEALMSASTP